MPINWVDVPDPKNPPNGAPKLNAANLARLALIEDIGVAGTATGDAGRAAFVAHGDLVLNIKDYGAKGDGSDATVAINAAFAAAAAVTSTTQLANNNDSVSLPIRPSVFIPDGEFGVSSQITIPQGVSVTATNGSKLKALSAMTSILRTDPAVLHQAERWNIGVLDCAGLAQSGFVVGAAIACDLHIREVFNPTQHALIVGEAAGVVTSYEMDVKVRRCWRPRGATPAAGYAGIWMQNCSDSVIEIGSVRGFDIGSRNDGGDNEFRTVHPWNATGSTGPTICHDDTATAAGTRLIGYVFDTPSTYGLRIRHSSTITLVGGHFYLNSGGVDNTAIAIYCDASPKLLALGAVIYGASASVRWKNDIVAVGTTANVRWMSYSDSTTVVTRNWGDRFYLPGFFLNSGSLTPVQGTLGSVDLFQFFNAGVKVGGINRYGMPYLPAYTTAGRPTASSAGGSVTGGVPAYWDTTLTRPIFSDGTNWRDATGTIV